MTYVPFAADDIRKKWKGLRDTFRKELRKYPHGFDADLSQEEVPWVFFKPLYFLKGQMRPRKSDASSLAGNGYHYLMGVTKEDEDDSAEDMLDRVDIEPSVCNTLRDLGMDSDKPRKSRRIPIGLRRFLRIRQGRAA